MATYFVGDVQGCVNELKALLKQVNFDCVVDSLYLAGDLVARGPHSLETLRFVKSLGDCVNIVLGNHDLHLLAVYAGIKQENKLDRLTPLLCAPDCDELINWLAQQPLIQRVKKHNKPDEYVYMTHAGISPQWQLSDALEQAELIHQKLISPQRNHWLALMYGQQPNSWKNAITEEDKFRYSINALTRMRFCFTDGSLEFTHKSSVNDAPNHLIPWFELSDTITEHTWVFGHWASLMGKSSHPNIYPLDTGCVWGNHLTMLRLGDYKIFTEPSNNE